MKVGDTGRMTANFTINDELIAKQGQTGRICAINDYDKIVTIDLGDTLPAVPLTLVEVIEERVIIEDSVKIVEPITFDRPSLHKVPVWLTEYAAHGIDALDDEQWDWIKEQKFSKLFDEITNEMNSWFWKGTVCEDYNVNRLKLVAAKLAMLIYQYERHPNNDDRPYIIKD